MGQLQQAGEITLRKFTADDIGGIMAWAGDDQVMVTTPNPTLQSDEDARRYYDATIAKHPWYRAICVDGEVAGAVYVTPAAAAGAHAVRGDLSYAIAQPYWGRGITTRASALAMATAPRDLRLARVQAYALDTNLPSQRVLEKCGFAREGLLRNFVHIRGAIRSVYVYSLLFDLDGKDD
jgi:RimJ/RimL family protein N-acetyltransferase